MIERLRNFVTARTGAITCTCASGGAFVHFAAHPCLEHFLAACFIWVVGFGLAIRDRVVS